jgi:hypothetical protein
MLKATALWAKTSVKGGQYLTDQLGGVKVLILAFCQVSRRNACKRQLIVVSRPAMPTEVGGLARD